VCVCDRFCWSVGMRGHRVLPQLPPDAAAFPVSVCCYTCVCFFLPQTHTLTSVLATRTLFHAHDPRAPPLNTAPMWVIRVYHQQAATSWPKKKQPNLKLLSAAIFFIACSHFCAHYFPLCCRVYRICT